MSQVQCSPELFVPAPSISQDHLLRLSYLLVMLLLKIRYARSMGTPKRNHAQVLCIVPRKYCNCKILKPGRGLVTRRGGLSDRFVIKRLRVGRSERIILYGRA